MGGEGDEFYLSYVTGDKGTIGCKNKYIVIESFFVGTENWLKEKKLNRNRA